MNTNSTTPTRWATSVVAARVMMTDSDDMTQKEFDAYLDYFEGKAQLDEDQFRESEEQQ